MNKEKFLRDIKSNIQRFGYHMTYVMPDLSPGFAYTVGLSEQYNFELAFAGGAFYKREEVISILKGISVKLIERTDINFDPILLEGLGTFSLTHIDNSWSKLLMLGVYDYYKTDKVYALQIIPDEEHFTLDIPDMTREFNIESEPIWQWMVKKWEYNVPKDSTVGTDIHFLKGAPLTEIARWEDNYWEMYHLDGDEVEKENIRIVSLGTVLAIDPSIIPALELPLSKGFLRDNINDAWRKWKW